MVYKVDGNPQLDTGWLTKLFNFVLKIKGGGRKCSVMNQHFAKKYIQ